MNESERGTDPVQASIGSGKRKEYGIENRTYDFAKAVRQFVKKLPVTISHREDVKQLVRASGSVAANYVEAVEALGERDRLLRLRISRKEAKESRLWLRLLTTENTPLDADRKKLADEATQLMNILGSIIRSSEAPQ